MRLSTITRRRFYASIAVIALLVARFSVPHAEAAVAYVSSAAFGWDDVSGTFAIDVGTGSDRVLIVWTTCDSSPDQADGVTFNGDAMTAIGMPSSTTNFASKGWILVNPDSGSHDVVVDTSTADEDCGAIAMAFSGVDQSDPIDQIANASGSSTTPSVTITGVAANAMVVDFVSFNGQGSRTFTAGADQTLRQDAICGEGAGDYDCVSSHEGPVTAGNKTMSYTVSSLGASWNILAVSLNIAPSGTPVVPFQPIQVSIF